MPPPGGRGAAAPYNRRVSGQISTAKHSTIRDCSAFREGLSPPANLVNSNAVRAVRRRGNVNNGANYGPRYVNANNAPSNSNWNYGAALCIPASQDKCFNVSTVRRFSVVLSGGSKYHPTGSAW